MKSITFNSPFLNEAVTIIKDEHNYQFLSTFFNVDAESLDELAFMCRKNTGNFIFGENVYLIGKRLE